MLRRDSIWFEAALGVVVGIAVLVLTWEPLTGGLLEDLELLSADARFEQRGPRPEVRATGDVVIVEIADDDVTALGGAFPFPRRYYAHVIENLNRAGARLIAFDLTFGRTAADDDALRQVLARYDNVVLAAKLQEHGVPGVAAVTRLDEDYGNVFADVNPQLGLVNVLKDRDDVVRRYAPMMAYGDTLVPTFALAALAAHDGHPPLATPTVEPGAFVLGEHRIPKDDARTFKLNYYGPVYTFRYLPFSHVIDDAGFRTADEEAYGVDLDLFDAATQALVRDKIVLIGSTMAEERDYHSVPFANPDDPDGSHTMHGVEIHATAIQNVLDGAYLQRPPRLVELLLILLLTPFVFTVATRVRRLKTRVPGVLEVALAGLMALVLWGLFEGAVWAFERDILVGIVPPSLAVLFGYVGSAAYSYAAEYKQRAFIKRMFGQYLNPQVVEVLAADPSKAKLGGERREMTVFFSDIAGFTSLSEALDAEALVALLNEYLDEMTQIVFRHGGTLDKYIGDAIMAFWNAPLDQPDHALRACRAALEMPARLEALNERWIAEGREPITARCGLNTDEMAVGNFGSAERFDYTVIGDGVNLASRLEGTNKVYGSAICISEATYARVREHVVVQELDVIRVQGKQRPVTVYALRALRPEGLPETEQKALDLFHEGLRLYRACRFDDALVQLQRVQKLDPACPAVDVYLDRIRHFHANPPPAEWDGVFTMTTK